MARPRLHHSILSRMIPSADCVLAGMMMLAILAGSAAWSSAHAQGAPEPDQASPGIPEAPIGHRQPRVQDLPPSVVRDEKKIEANQNALDKMLETSICRGC
jgi:hypothetical protein